MNLTGQRVPHAVIVVAFCAVAVLVYTACSYWVIVVSSDAALRGDTIGTWKSFATLAFGFWVGASSGGKARDANQPPPDKGVLDLTGAEQPKETL
jgi:hypothetical protein